MASFSKLSKYFCVVLASLVIYLFCLYFMTVNQRVARSSRAGGAKEERVSDDLSLKPFIVIPLSQLFNTFLTPTF
jgi:hypothetical protein